MHAFLWKFGCLPRWCVVLALLSGVSGRNSLGEDRFPEPVHLRTYKSPSGEFACVVDPSDLHGRGPARYRLSRKGTQVWAAERPFTLHEAAVTDTGLVAGYAYSKGLDGFGEGGFSAGPGDFRVVILDPKGGFILNEVVVREGSLALHAHPEPRARGLMVDGPNDRLVVRVETLTRKDLTKGWWTYRLSTGESLGKVDVEPKHSGGGWLAAARPVAGTPLTLLHFVVSSDESSGARFVLIDLNHSEVWSLALPKDYSIAGNEEAENQLRWKMHQHGAILDTSLSGLFEVLAAAKSERVLFRVRPAAAGTWDVKEVARTRYSDPADPASAPAAASEKPLRLLGSFRLRSPGDSSNAPIRDVGGFDFDARDRIGFVRDETGGRDSFVLIEQDGKVIREWPIPLPSVTNKVSHPTATWIEGDRWLLTRTTEGWNHLTIAAWLDATSGTVTEIKNFDCPAAKSVARLDDGGFVVLATKYLRFAGGYTPKDQLLAFDKGGDLRWLVTDDGRIGDSSLFSPQSIAFTTRRQVAVLSNIRPRLQFFDANGKFQSVVNLETAWGRKPNYPSDLSADTDGGVVVGDSNGKPPIVRMAADGKVRGELEPKHPGGQRLHGIHMSPSGKLWASDGEGLHRLDENGIVTFTLGAAPSPKRLGVIASVAVDGTGRLSAVDDRTGSIHVFDNTGFLRIAADGSTGSDRALAAAIREDKRRALPFGGLSLILGHNNAQIVEASGKTLRTILRGPDGRWLNRPHGASVGTDGSFVIWNSPYIAMSSEQSAYIHLYTADGEPRRTLTLPRDALSYTLAYNGTHIATLAGPHVWVFDTSGRLLRKFKADFEGYEEDCGFVFATRGTAELWLVFGRAKWVHRFALP